MDSDEQACRCICERQGGIVMAYTLQKLNVVKTAETEKQRDNLLAKGFTLVKEPSKKLPKKAGEAG